MGSRTKKEYRLLGGEPVLVRAVRPFLEEGFSPVVVTVPRGHPGEAAALLDAHLPLDSVRFVEGGATRQESVLRGLRSLAGEHPDLVLIHDGARPWLTRELVRRVAAAAGEHGACVPVVEVSEAVKQIELSGIVERHLSRQTIRFAQTPQGFLFARILAAHEKAAAAGAGCVDDAEVYALFEGPVAWVDGETDNRKITREQDLEGT
jgi:2-C-methyl-D-erythritol 4-phosphate cytidylyltransferase